MRASFYKDLLDNLYDGVYFTDRDRVITYWNQGAERISGYRASKVVGLSCKDGILMHVDAAGKNLCKEGCPLAKTIENGQPLEAEVFMHHKDGHRVPVLVRSSAIHGKDGTIVGAVEIFTDNTPKFSALQRIEDLEKVAYIDPLTELPNRRYMETQIRARMAEMERYGWQFGLLYFDIDYFKRVNDKYGHDTGDEVLRVVARTIQHATRSFDIAGRWGGEEFLAVLAGVDKEKLRVVGERYRSLVENSEVSAEGKTVRVTISLGGVVCRKGETVESIAKRADELLYRSKKNGRNRLTLDD